MARSSWSMAMRAVLPEALQLGCQDSCSASAGVVLKAMGMAAGIPLTSMLAQRAAADPQKGRVHQSALTF